MSRGRGSGSVASSPPTRRTPRSLSRSTPSTFPSGFSRRGSPLSVTTSTTVGGVAEGFNIPRTWALVKTNPFSAAKNPEPSATVPLPSYAQISRRLLHPFHGLRVNLPGSGPRGDLDLREGGFGDRHFCGLEVLMAGRATGGGSTAAASCGLEELEPPMRMATTMAPTRARPPPIPAISHGVADCCPALRRRGRSSLSSSSR